MPSTKKKIVIEAFKYRDMAFVYTKTGKAHRRLVMMGNLWDFHPYCHGIHTYGDFRSHDGLADAMFRYLTQQGRQVERKPTVELDEAGFKKHYGSDYC